MTSPTTLRRALPALLVAIGVLFLAPPTAYAHTDFDYSLPTDGASVGEPVDEITVAFTLPVTLVGNGFAVLDPQKNELAPFAVTDDDTVFRLQFDPPLAGGTVAVRYEVRAEDGHVLTGSFVFDVDAPVPTTAPATTTAPTTAPTTAAPIDSAPEVAVTTTVPTAATTIAPAGSEAAPTSVAATVDADVVAVAGAADDDDGGGTGVYIAIAAAVVLGAGGFLLVRSRTSGRA
jgi:methionine-rich copper-binding protein CopC